MKIDLKKNFREVIQVRLIVYSDTSREIYSHEECVTWDDSVGSISSGEMTNMGDGIDLAYSKVNPNKCTWLIVMTDGIPNKGKYQVKKSFEKLKKQAPPHTRIITLGYGDQYKPSILNSLGEFTHIEDSESIPIVFGSIANEIKYTWVFNVRWHCKKSFAGSKYIVGTYNVGCLYKQRKYVMGILLEQNPENWANEGMILKFTPVRSMKRMSVNFPIEVLDSPVDEVFRERYYLSAKCRRLNRLQNVYNTVPVFYHKVLEECMRIRRDLEEWIEECSLSLIKTNYSE